MAYGFSSVIIQTMVLYLINPDSLPKDKETGLFPDEVLDRLPESLKIVAVYLFVICLIGAFLMKSKKIPNKQSAFSQNIQTMSPNIIKDPLFYYTVIMFSLSLTGGYAVLSQYKEIGNAFEDKYLTLVVGNLASFANGGFRLFFGIAYDYFSFRQVFSILTFVNFILYTTIYFVREEHTLFAIYVFLGAAMEGGNFAIFPTLTVENFGQKIGMRVYSKVLIGILIANFGQ